MFYEWDLVRRYGNDKKWDASHTPSKVRHNVKYRRKNKTFTFTTYSYTDAMAKMEHLRGESDVFILDYYPSDEDGNTPLEVSSWL